MEEKKKHIFIVEEYEVSPEGGSHCIGVFSTIDNAKQCCINGGHIKIEKYIEDAKWSLRDTIEYENDRHDRSYYIYSLLEYMNELISAWKFKYIWDDNHYYIENDDEYSCRDAFYIKEFIIDKMPKFGKIGEVLV